MSITKLLNLIKDIKNARSGADVRNAIADAIKMTYDDASKEGNANMEVSLARGEHETLNERFEDNEQKINSNSVELAQKATDLEQRAINAKSFGAKVDGVTDDSGVIQNLINSIGDEETTIYLPPGLIRLNDFIRPKNNITIMGAGVDKTKIIGDSTYVHPFIDLNPASGEMLNNVTFKDLTIEALNESDASPVIRCNTDGNLENVTFENLKIITTGRLRTPIHLMSTNGEVTGLRVTNCHFEVGGAHTYGVFIQKPNKYTWVQNNFISLTHAESFNNIAVYADAKYFHVNNNTCFLGGHSPIAVSTGSYGEISGNYVEGANYPDEGGIEVEWKDSHGGVDTSHHVVVSGNIVKNANWGIVTTSRGLEPTNVHNVIISNNIISDCGNALFLSHTENILIANNTLNSTGNAIRVGENVQDMKISGNKIKVVNEVNGINFTQSSNRVTINDNEITLNGALYTPINLPNVSVATVNNNILRGGAVGVDVGGNSAKIVVANNIVEDAVNIGVYLRTGSSNCLVVGNMTINVTTGVDNRGTDNETYNNKTVA